MPDSTQNTQPTNTGFEFRLLGELTITRCQAPLGLPPYRTHGLLAALLLYPRPLRRDWLIGLLYPDLAERTGRRRLSDLVWLLRRALPDLPLETYGQEIYLAPETRWLDVEAFGRAALSDDLDGCLAALALYQGDLLEGLYDDWLLRERESLYLQHIRLLHQACDELAQRREFEAALPLAERLVRAESFDEKALRSLMKTYRALGRRGAALAAYERFVTMAADELDAEPEPATEALAQAIRGADTRVRLDPAPAPSADDTLEQVLDYARQALSRGDKAAVEACLACLGARSDGRELDVCLLEIDLAIAFEAYDRAQVLLDRCDAGQGAVLVRRANLALARHREAAAYEAASRALVLAREAGDRQTELEAMLPLAYTQRLLGQSIQAERTVERALRLARDSGAVEGVARALNLKGHCYFRQGQYTDALACYQEARSLAHEHRLRFCLASALSKIAWIQSYQGALLDALETGREALAIWRDLGMPGHEVYALQNLAYTLAQLGRTAESLRALEEVRHLCERFDMPVGKAINDYHLADTMLYHDDALAEQVIDIAASALAVLREHHQPGWEAAVLSTQGRALSLTGQYGAAVDVFRRAYSLYEQLGELGFLPELLAWQGFAHLGLGERDQALAATRRASLMLAQGQVSNEAESEVYCAHAMALDANGEHDQAQAYFVRAYGCLLHVAAQLQDAPAREAFFHHNSMTRRLMREVYARGIAPRPDSGLVSVRLPSVDERRSVRVRWTVDAGPADLALKQAHGAIALRRARLSRLIQEARMQGATPTVAHLAEVLGVSSRTIQRDLAVLRNAQLCHPFFFSK